MPRRLLLLGVALILVGNAQARPAATADTIASVAADGGGFEALSTSPGSDRWPIPSPDGKTIAFVHDEGTLDTIRVVGSDGSNERELGGGRLTSYPYYVNRPPTWSPDGSELFVSADVDYGSPRSEPVFVFVLTIAGGAPRELQSASTVTFSHDGRFAAYEIEQSPSVVPSADSVGVMHADLTHAVALGRGTALAWSPVADRIAFATRTGIAVDDASGERIWTLRGPFASTLAWMPGGKSIVYITKGKRPSLFAATVGRQATRRLVDLPNTAAPAGLYALSVSPNGRWVAATAGTVTFAASTNGTQFRVFPGSNARWGPTGSTLALISGSVLEIWPAGYLMQIATGVDPAGGLAWSPDGSRIYYAA